MKKLLTALLVTLFSGVLMAQQESTKKGFLGVFATPVDEALISHLGIDKNKSFIIQRVIKDSPASMAGIEKFDILLKVNDEDVDSTKPLALMIKKFKPEDKINLEMLRKGKVMNFDVTLGEPIPALELSDINDRIKLIVPDKNKIQDIRIEILDNIPQNKELHKKLQQSFKNQNGTLNAEIQKILEKIIKEGQGTNRIKVGGIVSSIINSSDDQHNIIIKVEDGEKTATVKDNNGKIIFEGAINTDAEIAAIPEEAREKVKKLKNKVHIMPSKFH